MRVPHSEGVANHTDPLSCVGHREVPGEALAGESIGQLLSRESRSTRDADAVLPRKRRTRYREVRSNPAWSETLACADAPCTGTGRSHGWSALLLRTKHTGADGNQVIERALGRPRRTNRRVNTASAGARKRPGWDGRCSRNSPFEAPESTIPRRRTHCVRHRFVQFCETIRQVIRRTACDEIFVFSLLPPR